MADYIRPQAERAPQLTEADLATLTVEQTNQARRNHQLDDLLAPATTTEPLALHVWDALSQPSRDAMVKAYGPGIAPTDTNQK